jgi:peptidoglycan/LPS O-acetylase OafA/YrhL
VRLHLRLPIFASNASASAGQPGGRRWQLRRSRADRPTAAGPRSGAHPGLVYQPGLDGLREPGLDGLRALAIIAVLLYHGGVSWAGGGFLGVESFFVLSGFLITSLLIAEWCESSRIRLGAFWARRARRLLPALFALVAVIGVYYTIAGPLNAVPGLRSDGIAALLYVGNWHQIATGSSYFVASGSVSPLQHTWSLAIEEQFYLLWPLILVAVFWLVGRGSASTHRSLTTLLGATIVAALASAGETAVLYRGGTGLGRVYYGTDTRATGLLVGASLAIAIARARQAGRRSPTGRRHRVGGAAALLALIMVLVAMHEATGESSWLFPWGFVGIDLAVATVIAAVVLLPESSIARVFSVRPLCAIGTISYGVYLWHFPCFLWLDQSSTGCSGAALLLVRLAVTFAVAVVSFIAIEQPVRRRKVPSWGLRPLVPAAVAGSLAALTAAAAVGAETPGGKLAAVPASVAHRFVGHDRQCSVSLPDTAQYRAVPLPQSALGGYIFHWILKGAVDWNGGAYPQSGRMRYRTCPPKRVLMIGDSIAFTAGVPMLENENRYGVELANAAILGCAFGNRGQLDVNGSDKALPAQCPDDLGRWERAARAFQAQVVVVELGYRDEFNWDWNGRAVHLGQRTFDAYVQQRIDRFAQILSNGGAQVLFLTVPFVSPPALANGSPSPAGAPARHALINSMLESAASQDPSRVAVLNVDSVVSPGNHYDGTVNGQGCRFDGIHFSIYCASLLQPVVLGRARELIDR